jgi:iron(III) transport system substrate-binding protein
MPGHPRGNLAAVPFVIMILISFVAASCTGGDGSSGAKSEQEVLTIYSGRSEKLVGPIIEQFSEVSDVKTEVKYGSTPEIAATLLEEGSKSPADIFIAQDPGGLGAVDALLTPLPGEITDPVDARFKSAGGKWVGLSGRARTVVYNTSKLSESDLPDDIWGFTDPGWKGRLGWAPTNASFQTMVTAMIDLWGEDKTAEWLSGIQANNPKTYPNNSSIVLAAESGEIDAGFVNHYYLYRLLAEKGENIPVRNYHPRAGGPGAIIMVAGAGITETSDNKEAAEKFIKFMLSPVAQQYFTGQTYEYPVIDGVVTNRLLVPLTDISSPNIDTKKLADPEAAVGLLREQNIIP